MLFTMQNFTRRILPVLAVLAVACAQVFGLGRGYLCDCGGVEKVTMADHCHGPHSEACHEHEEDLPCNSEDDQHYEGDTHSHTALIESLRASPVSHLQVAAPVPVVIGFIMPQWTQAEVSACQPMSAQPQWQVPDRTRAWTHVLAHAVVLRI